MPMLREGMYATSLVPSPFFTRRRRVGCWGEKEGLVSSGCACADFSKTTKSVTSKLK